VKEENIAIDDHNVKTNPVFVKSTALINTRPIRTHYLAGMSGCIKNYIMFGSRSRTIIPTIAPPWVSLDLPRSRERPG